MAVSGLYPLAYLGVNARTPPTLIKKTFNPESDNTNFVVGTIWINTSTDSIFFLTNLDAGVATWTPLEGTDLVVNADSGSATESSGEITISGGNIVTTEGAGSTVSVALTQGTSGQIPIGSTGAAPIWANLASSGGSVTITNTANGINLEAAGVAALTQLDGDTGSAVPAAGIITLAGGTNITSVAGTNTVTFNLDGSPSITGLTVSGLTTGMVFSDVSGVLSSSTGTDGQVILGSTGSSPVFGDLASADGSIDFTSGAGTLDLSVTGQLTFNVQTGTTYTLVLTDVNKLVTLDNGSAITLTVPPNADVAFPVGTQILLQAKGAGTVTFTEGAAVTIVSRGSVFDSAGQYAMASLIKDGTDTWILSGDIA